MTGTPNRSAGSSHRRYLTKLAELMVVPHIAQNGSESIVLSIIFPSTSKYNPPPLGPILRSDRNPPAEHAVCTPTPVPAAGERDGANTCVGTDD